MSIEELRAVIREIFPSYTTDSYFKNDDDTVGYKWITGGRHGSWHGDGGNRKFAGTEVIRTGEDTYLVNEWRGGIGEMTRAELERKVVPVAAERASERSHRLIYA